MIAIDGANGQGQGVVVVGINRQDIEQLLEGKGGFKLKISAMSVGHLPLSHITLVAGETDEDIQGKFEDLGVQIQQPPVGQRN